jgi:ribosomal-protein-serine acetyltransferase
MAAVADALFTFSLGDDAALLPRTPAIAEPYHELLAANIDRLIRWLPGLDALPSIEATRADLAQRGQAWLDGSQLPLAIAVPADGGWRLVGEVNLLIDKHIRSAEVGYWLDAGFAGRGLASRAVSAALDWAFGPLGLRRVKLFALADNEPSIRVAQRLGFTREGLFRAGAVVAGAEHDVVGYGLLAREWVGAGQRAAADGLGGQPIHQAAAPGRGPN